jgi:hypothetical protein
MFAVALVPIVISLNRGLWIALSVMIAYLAFRRALDGDLRMVGVAIGVVVLVTVLFFVTPAGDLITARINAAGDSNQARSSVYKDAFHGAVQSPLLGAGAPKKVAGSADPPIGTHGLIWYLLFVHGFIATALFIAWLVCELWKSAPSRAPNSIYFHLVIVVACVQFAYYGMLPQIVIVGIAAGLARREAAQERAARERAIAARLPRVPARAETLVDVT